MRRQPAIHVRIHVGLTSMADSSRSEAPSKDARSTQMNLHPCVAASVLRTSDPLPLTPHFTYYVASNSPKQHRAQSITNPVGTEHMHTAWLRVVRSTRVCVEDRTALSFWEHTRIQWISTPQESRTRLYAEPLT